jgi:hypothetical protein
LLLVGFFFFFFLLGGGAAPPPPRGQWVTVPIDPVDQRDLSRHVMECHRVLAQADSPMSGAFAKIADQLERELAQSL